MQNLTFAPAANMADALVLLDQLPKAIAEDAPIDVDCARIARNLKSENRRIVGVLPANDKVDVLAFCAQVARALHLISSERVVVLDLERSGMGAPAQAGLHFASAMAKGVVAIAPREMRPRGEKSFGLEDLLQFIYTRSEAFAFVLVDLKGCQWPGELATALSKVQGVVILGACGRVTDRELIAMSSRISSEINLGVALME